MHRPEVREDIEQKRNVWLEYTVSGEKGGKRAGDISKHWVLKALC